MWYFVYSFFFNLYVPVTVFCKWHLFLFFGTSNNCFSVLLHTQSVEQLAYFIREPGAIIIPETFDSTVQFGTVHGNPTKGVLHFMEALHAPLVSLSTTWEKTMKDNYTNNMHCLLADLTGVYLKQIVTEIERHAEHMVQEQRHIGDKRERTRLTLK